MSWVVATRTSDLTVTTTGGVVSWQAAAQSGGTFWSAGNPDRITPGGTLIYPSVYLCASFVNADDSREIRQTLRRNGSDFRINEDENPKFGAGIAYGRLGFVTSDYITAFLQTVGGNRTMEHEYSAFSMATEEREGLILAQSSSYDTGTGLITWGTIRQTDYLMEQGSEAFTVPAGIGAVIVSVTSDGSGNNALPWECRLNGTTIRRQQAPASNSGQACPSTFGVIPVAEGDAVTVALGTGSGTVTLNSAATRLTIEMLA